MSRCGVQEDTGGWVVIQLPGADSTCCPRTDRVIHSLFIRDVQKQDHILYEIVASLIKLTDCVQSHDAKHCNILHSGDCMRFTIKLGISDMPKHARLPTSSLKWKPHFTIPKPFRLCVDHESRLLFPCISALSSTYIGYYLFTPLMPTLTQDHSCPNLATSHQNYFLGSSAL